MSEAFTILPPESQGTAYALLFGIEAYQAERIDNVSYAKRDATEVTNALLNLDYEERNVQLIVNEAATCTSIRYHAKQLAGTAKEGDTVFIFFAGHGYTWQGENYLMANDTRQDDIEGTGISLKELFTLFSNSKCKQVMFFLDCCHSGLHLGEEERGVLEDFSTEELNEYFKQAEFCVVFSACDKGEKSHPSIQFKHGYWTYHLLRALRGEEPGLLDGKGRLRSIVLQDYLRIEVPKQLALQSTVKRQQNPKMFGDVSGSFVVADLGDLLVRQKAERRAKAVGLKDAILRSFETGSVRELSGFVKGGHKLPTYYNRTSQNWVEGLAEGDLSEEMEKYYEKIRDAGVYKRKELQYDSPSDGSSSIRTPDFALSITYYQLEDSPSEYEMVRELTRLNNPDILDQDWFNDVFRGVFNEVVFDLTAPLDVEQFIDIAEDIDELGVDYNAKATCCALTIAEFAGKITVTKDSITYSFHKAETPKEMALQLQSVSVALAGVPEIQKALPL